MKFRSLKVSQVSNSNFLKPTAGVRLEISKSAGKNRAKVCNTHIAYIYIHTHSSV